MNDLQTTIENAVTLADAQKWWLLSAMVIGAVVRLSKPDVTAWLLKYFNLTPRMRPVLAAILGIVVSICDMIVSGSDLKSSLKWGMSAAVAAMISHTFGIEVVRDGRELGEPKAGPGRFSRRPSGRPPAGGEGFEIDISHMSDNPPSPMPSSFPKPGKYPPSFRFAAFGLACIATMGCTSMLPIVTELIRDVADAAQILDAITTAERIWFTSHPAGEIQAKIDQALTDAHLALATALRATRGVRDLTDEQFDAAFADFRLAYAGLQTLLRDAGIVRGGSKISVARGGEIFLPEPMALARRHP